MRELLTSIVCMSVAAALIYEMEPAEMYRNERPSERVSRLKKAEETIGSAFSVIFLVGVSAYVLSVL